MAYEGLPVPGGLKGKRLGILRDLFRTGPELGETNALIDAAFVAMKTEGAVVPDPIASPTQSPRADFTPQIKERYLESDKVPPMELSAEYAA